MKSVSKHAIKVKVIFKGELDKTFIWNDSKVVLSQGVASRIGVA